MTKNEFRADDASEANAALLAQRIALKLKPGDTITLSGDLGAGKTTFARALIRALLNDADAEVPSPTFSLIQTYDAPRLTLAHLDLYRLTEEQEAYELGLEDLLVTGAAIIEWPERALGIVSRDRLDLQITERSADTRDITVTADGTWIERLDRIKDITSFSAFDPVWANAGVAYLQGDASARAYARLTSADGTRAILMDSPKVPDGPPIRDGLPYSRIAHLAEDVAPFVAIAGALKDAGLSAPEIYHADLERGLLLLEDLGDRVFGREVENGADQQMLWTAATDALLALHQQPVPERIPLANGTHYTIPKQDRRCLQIEVELLTDWYWPALFGSPAPDDVREEFLEVWNSVFDILLELPGGWILRDFHSPNLIWLPERHGVRKTGIIDFQDALYGPPAYDLVSLLQDARIDVPADLEAATFEHYCAIAAKDQPAFEREAFSFAYSALGAQRNTKILGIFARLARRDGKPGYLRHIPRLWRYLERDLAHPGLGELRTWFDRHIDADDRARNIEA